MEIEQKLLQFISQELLRGNHQIDRGENLLDSGLIDSVGAIRLLGFIQDTYGIKVPPEDFIIENFESITAMRSYLEPKIETP